METDIAVIGAGPAGLQAAIHAARKKVGVLVLGKPANSSLHYAHVENFCCMQGVARGGDMLADGRRQAEGFGAKFLEEDITGIEAGGGAFLIATESGEKIRARSVIFALGIKRNRLNVKGEKELYGKGVSYCVECDANFFRGKRVCVTGNGSAAASGAVLLTAYAAEVTLVAEKLAANERLLQQLAASGVKVLEGRKVAEIAGSPKVSAVKLSDGAELAVDGVFIELGAKGAMELAAGLGAELDGDSFQFIKTDKGQRTSVPGVYAAGDICGAPFQLAKAIGEGCVAGLNAADHVKNSCKPA